jgi:hypothetical protein
MAVKTAVQILCAHHAINVSVSNVVRISITRAADHIAHVAATTVVMHVDDVDAMRQIAIARHAVGQHHDHGHG